MEAPLPPTEPGLQPGLEKKTKALSEALEKQDIMTVYGGQDDTGIDAVKAQLDADPNNPMFARLVCLPALFETIGIIEAIQAYKRPRDRLRPLRQNALYYLGNAYLKTFQISRGKNNIGNCYVLISLVLS